MDSWTVICVHGDNKLITNAVHLEQSPVAWPMSRNRATVQCTAWRKAQVFNSTCVWRTRLKGLQDANYLVRCECLQVQITACIRRYMHDIARSQYIGEILITCMCMSTSTSLATQFNPGTLGDIEAMSKQMINKRCWRHNMRMTSVCLSLNHSDYKRRVAVIASSTATHSELTALSYICLYLGRRFALTQIDAPHSSVSFVIYVRIIIDDSDRCAVVRSRKSTADKHFEESRTFFCSSREDWVNDCSANETEHTKRRTTSALFNQQ